MRSYSALVLIMIGISFYSCDNVINKRLDEICTIADKEPERAQVMLDSIRSNIKSLSKEDKNYMRLLQIKCEDKMYVPHTSDSVILEIIDHYQNSGNQRRLMTALYYGGRVYRDIGDSPRALRYLQQALDVAEKLDAEDMESLIGSQMGQLYIEQHLYDLAQAAFERAIRHSSAQGDSIGVVMDMSAIGHIYICRKQYDKAIAELRDALAVARAIGDSTCVGDCYRQLSAVYMWNGDYTMGLAILDSVPKEDKHYHNNTRASLLALYHWGQGNRDSLISYSNYLVDNGSLSQQMTSHARLAWIAIQDSLPQVAIPHLDAYILLRDSIDKQRDAENIRHISTMYNYSLYEKENINLMIENQKRKMTIIVLFSIVVLLSVIAIGVWRHNIAKNFMLRVRLRAEQKLKKEIYQRSEEYISENSRKIALMNKKLESSDQLNKQLKLQVEHQRILLLNATERAREEIRYKEEIKAHVSQSETVRSISQMLKGKSTVRMPEDMWERIVEEIEMAYPNFIPTLDELPIQLSDFERKISFLTKLGFVPSDIAVLTNHSKEAVSSARRRLYKKVFGTVGTPGDWDNFILSI